MLYAREATVQDAIQLSSNLRPEDEAEVIANTGADPLVSLLNGVLFSDNPTAILETETDSVVAIYGASTRKDSPKVGMVWMLCSPQLLEHRIQFLRESRNYFNKLMANYDLLYNFVDERNVVHIRWLEWLGFKLLTRHETFGAEGRPFIEFVRIKD